MMTGDVELTVVAKISLLHQYRRKKHPKKQKAKEC